MPLTKKQQMQSMEDEANKEYSMKDLYSNLRNMFNPQQFVAPKVRNLSKEQKDAEIAKKFEVEDVNKSQQDYKKAMDMIRAREGEANPMMDVIKKRLSPRPEFQTEMSDQEAADMMNQFQPSDEEARQMELKRQLIKRLNNQ